MAFFMDGFDYYTSLTANGYAPNAAAMTTIGAGAYSYGRAARADAFSGNFSRSMAKVINGASPATNWPTFYMGHHMQVGSYTNCRIMWYDGGTTQCSLSFDAGGLLVFSRGDRAVTLGTSALAWPGGFAWIAVKLVFSNTVGSIQVYVNGTLYLNLTGLDNCITANEYCNDMLWVAGSGNLDVDNLHVYNGADPAPYNAILTERRIRFQLPDANGTLQDWTASAGSAYQCIDENPPNSGTDYIAAATVANKSTFGFPDFSGLGTIDAVNVVFTATKDDAGARAVKAAIRNSGGSLAYSSDRSMTTSYLAYGYTMLLDPLTSGAWSLANLNGYQYGVEVAA